MFRRAFSQIPKQSSSHGLRNWILGLGTSVIGTGVIVYHLPKSMQDAIYDEFLMKGLRVFDPEDAHRLAICAARYGFLPKDRTPDPRNLHTRVFGIEFPNPVGMAAGFDKHGEAMTGLLDMGFGFVEIGSVTPLPQDGNAKPRVFRLMEDKGVINRYGFNSEGFEKVQERLIKFAATRKQNESDGHRPGVLGINLGKNKLTENAVEDYIAGVKAIGSYGDYIVINVSSPNTPGLRNLQGKEQLQTLIQRVKETRDREVKSIPLLVKIAPDLTMQDKKDIADVVLSTKIDGLIVSNTTISRPEFLKSAAKQETGGLSGAPIKQLSTKVLYDMYELTKGQVPIIGVGGIANGYDAYEKIKAGASLVQIYSSLVYEGPGCISRIKSELSELLEKDGYTSIDQAVGASHQK